MKTILLSLLLLPTISHAETKVTGAEISTTTTIVVASATITTLRSDTAWTVVCATSTTAQVSSLVCSGLPGVGKYRAYVDVYKTTPGNMLWRFNGDAGSNYRWVTQARAVNTGAGAAAENPGGQWYLNSADPVVTGEVMFTDIAFATSVAGYSVIRGAWNSGFINSGGNWELVNGAGFYNGGFAPTSVGVYASAGTWTGSITVYYTK